MTAGGGKGRKKNRVDMYEVIVIKEGYSIKEGPGQQKACGSITLLKGPHNIIVDTGNPWDRDLILEGLSMQGIQAEAVSYVVCTHGQGDKVGNLNIFPNATCIIGKNISHGDRYLLHGFAQKLVQKIFLAPDQLGIPNLMCLKKHEINPDRIEFVVCTHGHSDHIGNLNLFTGAIHIVSHDICVGDMYYIHDFKQGIPYEIDDDVEVVSTPGHTGSDVSVLVKNTKQGSVAITGDLFECDADLEDFSLWQENSENPELQQQNRMAILKFADWIVPGHGAMFKVPEDYKHQMKMVMYYEQRTYDGPDGSRSEVRSEVNYVVLEED